PRLTPSGERPGTFGPPPAMVFRHRHPGPAPHPGPTADRRSCRPPGSIAHHRASSRRSPIPRGARGGAGPLGLKGPAPFGPRTLAGRRRPAAGGAEGQAGRARFLRTQIRTPPRPRAVKQTLVGSGTAVTTGTKDPLLVVNRKSGPVTLLVA